MKNLCTKSPPRWRVTITVMFILLTAMVIAFPHNALAALEGDAGNSIIRNVVKVTYEDLSGNSSTIYDSIDVTVNTVDVAPTVLSITPSPGSTSATGDTQAYTVTIRSNSNGPGSIGLSGSDGSASNITLSGTGPSFSPNTLYLGSTIIDPTDTNVTIAAGGSATFNVPNDGAAGLKDDGSAGAYNDGTINGLISGDTVYLYNGTNYYPLTVGTVTDPDPGNFDTAAGTGNKTAAVATIVLNNASASAITVTAGAPWMILEAKTTTMTVTQGTISDPTSAAYWVTTVTASMNGQDGTNTVTTNAAAGALTVSKFVRNIDTPVAGLTSKVYPTGTTYYASGVNGKPGETLEYLIFIKNTGTATATNIVASDYIPEYTTYKPTSVVMGVDANADGTNNVDYTENGEENDATGDGIVWLDSSGAQPILNVYAGQDATALLVGGSDNATTPTGGELPATGEIFITFQVTID